MVDNVEIDYNFQKGNKYTGYFFIILNIIILIIIYIIIKSKSKAIRTIKIKLFLLIFSDQIYIILYNYIGYFYDTLFEELFFTCLESIQFYLFLSIIYDIFKNTKISILSKNVKLINPFYLSICFFMVKISYFKYLNLGINPQIINFFHYFTVLGGLIFLYRYMKKITISFSSNLMSTDFGAKNVYNNLKLLYRISLIIFIFINCIKLISIFIDKEYVIYFQIPNNIFNYSVKYINFIIFAITAYILNKNYRRNYNKDETIGINKISL